jgi:hypothetical protein
MSKDFKLIIIAFTLLLYGCPSDTTVDTSLAKPKSSSKSHNYIVLLDLSDRIIKKNDQIERDKLIINHIYDSFEKSVRSNLFVKSKDQIKIVIAPQKGSKLDVSKFESDLYIKMQTIPLKDRKGLEKERKSKFISSVDNLYKEAKFSDNLNDYKGADIWKYFDEDLEKSIVDDSNFINHIFIITDGYMFISGKQAELAKDWLSVNKKFKNIDAALLEATPKENIDYEWERIEKSWSKWLSNMGIESVLMEKYGNINQTKDNIDAFLKGDEGVLFKLNDVNIAPIDPPAVAGAQSQNDESLPSSNKTKSELKENTVNNQNLKKQNSNRSLSYKNGIQTLNPIVNQNSRVIEWGSIVPKGKNPVATIKIKIEPISDKSEDSFNRTFTITGDADSFKLPEIQGPQAKHKTFKVIIEVFDNYKNKIAGGTINSTELPCGS